MIFILFMRTYISWNTALNVSSEETSLLNTARKSPLPGHYNGDKLKDCFCKLFMATTQLQLRRWPKIPFLFCRLLTRSGINIFHSCSTSWEPTLQWLYDHTLSTLQWITFTTISIEAFFLANSIALFTDKSNDAHCKPTYCWSWVLNPWQLPLWTGFEGTQEASEPEISHLLG